MLVSFQSFISSVLQPLPPNLYCAQFQGALRVSVLRAIVARNLINLGKKQYFNPTSHGISAKANCLKQWAAYHPHVVTKRKITILEQCLPISPEKLLYQDLQCSLRDYEDLPMLPLPVHAFYQLTLAGSWKHLV